MNSEGFGEPMHPRSLTRAFAVHLTQYSELVKAADKKPGIWSHWIAVHVLSVEQIRRVFEDNLEIIFIISPQKHMLWVLIRRGDSNEYPQHMFL